MILHINIFFIDRIYLVVSYNLYYHIIYIIIIYSIYIIIIETYYTKCLFNNYINVQINYLKNYLRFKKIVILVFFY